MLSGTTEGILILLVISMVPSFLITLPCFVLLVKADDFNYCLYYFLIGMVGAVGTIIGYVMTFMYANQGLLWY